jgi:hypothetical protein
LSCPDRETAPPSVGVGGQVFASHLVEGAHGSVQGADSVERLQLPIVWGFLMKTASLSSCVFRLDYI